MQLFNGTLRCLQGLHTAKFNVKFLAQTYGVPNKSSSCLAGQNRCYANANTTAIAMSSEQFDAPTSDASKTPLITAHGLFGSKQNWRSVSRAIAKETHRRVSHEIDFLFAILSQNVQCFAGLCGGFTQSWRQSTYRHTRLSRHDGGHQRLHGRQFDQKDKFDGSQYGRTCCHALCFN